MAVLASQRDVTAERQAERLHRELFQGCRVPMLFIDPQDGAIRDANPAAAAHYGHSPERLRAMRIAEINCLAPEEVSAEMEEAHARRRSHFLFRHRLASGEVRDVEVHSGPVDLGDRRLRYSIVHDITERRAAERALREGERKYRRLVESTPAGLWMIDAEGRTLEVNPALCPMLGREPEWLLGRRLLDLVDGEEGAQIGELIAGTAAGDQRRFEVGLRHRDGRLVPTLFNATALREEGARWPAPSRSSAT
jgi:PAS domain S-box-containing protein